MSANPKQLTSRQRVILAKILAGATAMETRGRVYYWTLTDREATRCTKQIPVLLRLGLLDVVKCDWRGRHCVARRGEMDRTDEWPCPSCGHVHAERVTCEEAVRAERLQEAIDRQEERDRNER